MNNMATFPLVFRSITALWPSRLTLPGRFPCKQSAFHTAGIRKVGACTCDYALVQKQRTSKERKRNTAASIKPQRASNKDVVREIGSSNLFKYPKLGKWS